MCLRLAVAVSGWGGHHLICITRAPLLLLLILLLMQLPLQGSCSRGDRSYVFQHCLVRCNYTDCTQRTRTMRQPLAWSLWLTGWTCLDNCKYLCMWRAVDAFQRDRLPLPQFYGKWPFVRLWGMQEPASALFSLANLMCNLVTVTQFVRVVPSTAPTYGMWLLYCVAVCNAWLWSTVFHTRDTDFTEKMDYFGALSFLLVSLMALLMRLFWEKQLRIGSYEEKRNYFSWLLFFGMALFFMGHTGYLSFVHFDYRYNMIVNIGVAATASLGWAAWAWYRRGALGHARYALMTQILFINFSLLEMLDFEPLWWTLDAHAVWHAATVLMPLIWFRFIIADCLHLESIRIQESKSRLPLLDGKVGHKVY